jgi:membrane protease YdiL (CAAX protease family)
MATLSNSFASRSSVRPLLLLGAAPVLALTATQAVRDAGLLAIFGLLLVLPLAQELVLRGVVQRRLLQLRLGGVLTVVALAALAAALHAAVGGITLALVALITALVSGAMYSRSRRVLPCVLMVAAGNLLHLAAVSSQAV